MFTDCSRKEKEEVRGFLAGVHLGLVSKGGRRRKKQSHPKHIRIQKVNPWLQNVHQEGKEAESFHEKRNGEKLQAPVISSCLGHQAGSWLLIMYRLEGNTP